MYNLSNSSPKTTQKISFLPKSNFETEKVNVIQILHHIQNKNIY